MYKRYNTTWTKYIGTRMQITAQHGGLMFSILSCFFFFFFSLQKLQQLRAKQYKNYEIDGKTTKMLKNE